MPGKASKDFLTRSLPTVLPAEIEDHEFDEVIDVRAPAEFMDDHVPGAINLPVLDDDQRSEVGRVYKQVSPFEARRMGAGLVSSNIAAHFRKHFRDKQVNYRPLVYCWRGGQRSSSMATVLSEVGWRVHLIDGGYRAYRKYISNCLESIFDQITCFRVIAGLTGAGKTLLLKRLHEAGHQVIDLEGLACHRGSALGEDPERGQPSQKRFETLLFRQFSGMDYSRPIYVESESSRVGRVQVPASMWALMKEASVIELDVPLEARARYLLGEYGHFTGSPELLLKKMEPILPMHSTDVVDQWSESIREGDFMAFVKSILKHHYDPAYLRSRKKTYKLPLVSLSIDQVGCESVDKVMNQILNHEQDSKFDR